MQVYGDEAGELSDRLLGFVGDGESANKAALANLEQQYPFLVNVWCQAHCLSLLLKVRPLAQCNKSLLKLFVIRDYSLTHSVMQDLARSYAPFQQAMDDAHLMVKELHAHADIRQKLKM